MRRDRSLFPFWYNAGHAARAIAGRPQEDWNAESGKIKAAGPFAAAFGTGNYSGASRVSEAVYAHARNHAGLRAHRIPRLFRIYSRGGGIFRRLPAARGIVH